MVVILFFFNDTATTEIYTYCHTLSLHDALPFYHPALDTRRRPVAEADHLGDMGAAAQGLALGTWHQPRDHATDLGRADIEHGYQRRSEEHTSELQSLMRISYAVFCLKKKNHTFSIH